MTKKALLTKLFILSIEIKETVQNCGVKSCKACRTEKRYMKFMEEAIRFIKEQ